MNAESRRGELLAQYVASWGRLDRLDLRESIDPISRTLVGDSEHRSGADHWRSLQVTTDRSMLDAVYARLPARFPPLFEQLVLSYRWLEVDL